MDPSPAAISRLLTTSLLLGLAAVGCNRESPATTPNPTHDAALRPTPVVAEEPGTRLAPILSGHVEFDPWAMTATLTPYRSASAGSQDILETVDVTQFFTSAPCKDCLAITGIGVAESGNPTLDISIRHPFPSPAPTVALNQDFSVFNVEAVVLFDDTGETVTNFPTIAQSVLTSKRLVNADGYTGYLDGAYDVDYFATTATIHPYRLFYRDYSTGTFDGANPQGFPDYADVRGFLGMGQGKGPDVQTFEFSLPARGQTLGFELIVQASFGNGASNRTEKAAPEYRLPQYNKKAASEVHAGLSNASPASPNGLGLLDSITNSAAMVRVQALDLTDASTGVTVGSNRDQIRAASDVDAITLEIPGVLNSAGSHPDPATIFVSGAGNTPGAPLTYNIPITNEAAADEGSYFGLVKMLDSYPTGQNPVFLEDAYHYASPGFTQPFPITEMATYALVPVTVGPNTQTPLQGQENGLLLGSAIAVGDFNNDGVLDIAASSPEATAGSQTKAGKVFVYFGFANGVFAPPVFLQEFTPTINVRLGFDLEVADIEGDGDDDLLASAINNSPGRVIVYRAVGLGFLTGVTVQDSSLPAGSKFGNTIVVADLNQDGKDDALIAATAAAGAGPNEGKVYRYLSNGVTLTSPLVYTATDTGADILFGTGMAIVRDVSGAPATAVIGAPGYSTNTGRAYLKSIDTGGALGTSVPLDSIAPIAQANFGFTIAAADLNADDREDLIIGVPGSASLAQGHVETFLQDGTGAFVGTDQLTISGSDTFSFGSTVVTGDFDNNGRVDVAAGGLLLTAATITQAGRAAIFPEGRPTGTQLLEFQLVTPTSGDLFTRALAVYPREGKRDMLLVGASGDDPGGFTDAGAVYFY